MTSPASTGPASTGPTGDPGGWNVSPRVLWLLLAGIAAYDAIYLATWLIRDTSPPFGDFFALWSFGGFALLHPPAAIYDQAALKLFQQGLAPAFTGGYPFFYPPSFLLAVVPIALLPLDAAWLCWSLGTLALYVAASLGQRWRSRAGTAFLVAPTTLLCIVAGQSGLLMGALLIGGLRAVPARPWLGGALLGLLTVKPQLGLLLPVALAAAGQWRALMAAALAAVAVALASGLAFGWQAWVAWAQTIPLSAQVVMLNRADVARLMPTVTAGLFQLGVPDGWARLLQLAAGLAAAFATWRAFRPGVSPDAVAVLAMATFLVTPYGYVYDMPVVTAALLLVVLSRPLGRAEPMLFGLAAAVPLLMVTRDLPLLEPALLAAATALLTLRAGQAQRRHLDKLPSTPAG